MLSIALVISLGGVSRASYTNITRWLNTALNPDLFVSATESMVSHSYRFPPSVGEALKSVEGVAQVHPVRDARIIFRGTPVLLLATDVGAIRDNARLPAIEGNTEEMYRLTAQGKGVIVADNLALLKGIRLGETIDIPSPAGLVRLPVAGITLEYSDQQGTIMMDRSVFMKYWNDDSVNIFRVYLKPGASDTAVRQAMLAKLGSETRLFVLTNRELRDYILRLTDQWFGLTYVKISVDDLGCVLGFVRTLTVSISERRRELGVLQAVGVLREQIRRTVWIESLAIGLLGLIMGLGRGAVQLL
jgi:putative ABC transport system permease protein